MTEPSLESKARAAWLPAGLISWYASDGGPVAMVTSWVALIGGPRPRLRVAWHGRHSPMARHWRGGDFVLNIPHESGLDKIRQVMLQGKLCMNPEVDLGFKAASGCLALAPRLLDCAVQIECVAGKLVDAGYEEELCGDVVHVQRGELVLDAADSGDISSILLLRPVPDR